MEHKFLIERIENKTHTVMSLFLGIIILLGLFLAGDVFLSKYIPFNYLRFSYLFILSAWVIYWGFNRFWIPRNNKKQTGLIICIYADSDEAKQSLKRDFVDTLKKQLINENLDNVFNTIVIKNHLALKFNNFKSIIKLHKRTRGHIYIFGEVKKRKNGKEQYFISLDGLVLHRPVAKYISQELAKDFLATLPKNINFSEEFAFSGFNVSADIVTKSIKYIVGVASSISGNPFLATVLHESLKKHILSENQKTPGDNLILSKIDNLLSNEYAIISLYYFEKGDKDKTYENLNLSLGLNNNCYRALIMESIISFAWENDPIKALSATKKCHGFIYHEWRYNEAFLLFWTNNYPQAIKQCEKIRNQNYSDEFNISKQVTTFNENIILSDGSKPALYFWLGFNYYYKQDNLPLALKYFELFEQKCDSSLLMLKQKSTPWLVDIRQKMKINNI